MIVARPFALAAGVIAAALALLSPALATDGATVPQSARDRAAERAGTADVGTAGAGQSGLKTLYRTFGKYRLSTAAGGGQAVNTVTVVKPAADAKVLKAFLMSSAYLIGTNQVAETPDGVVAIDGAAVTWTAKQRNVFDFFEASAADVTALVRAKLNSAAVGNVSFSVQETANPKVAFHGHILAVVFRTPSDPEPRTIALMFGGQVPSGDVFELILTQPIDKTAPGARAEMGFGIGGSSQSSAGSSNRTIASVNGRLLTSSAGGQDDGTPGLITVGGVGDVRANPPANALPANPRTDDEYYNLLGSLTVASRRIRVETSNPSGDDNLFFAWFDLSAKSSSGVDSDGDGLLDAWETSGVDADGDGVVDLKLRPLGANPRRKDIFIAYAWMSAGPGESASHEPSAAVLQAVTDAFARAPVTNPDGSTGITVHWKHLGSVAHDDDLNPVWTEFDAIMDSKLTAAERRVYHRMLNAHAYNNGGSSGISRDIPASDFVESLGRFSTNPGTLVQRAGTIMHELGHNLGLRHGGVDHVNYKPNHLSVMGYLNQLDWLTRDSAPWLDYERFELGDMDENALREPPGLQAPGAEGELARYGVRWSHPFFSAYLSKTTGANANVDWNVSGAIDAGAFAQDVNRSGGRSVLRAAYSEWDNLIYDGGQIGASEPLTGAAARRSLVTSPDDLRELTEQDYLEMTRNRPRR